MTTHELSTLLAGAPVIQGVSPVAPAASEAGATTGQKITPLSRWNLLARFVLSLAILLTAYVVVS